ncbi:MAG: fibrillarin-like rRNA/tRNA 2'-O-methyltransferase [Methanoregulaceae archaeon]|nr:fibrillarin-like rRNA/tRNA 2'-O-methyltransferase [Methanoregulaceae archaeon]
MIWIDDQLVSPGKEGVYGERTLKGFRLWDPRRSKLSALYHLGQGIELEPQHRVLYLGAANGTTVSHVSDYVEVVYAVEPAPRPFQDLLFVAEGRENIIPIMADARKPYLYRPIVEKVDLIYQDVAQRDQGEILLSNTGFLKSGGATILMLKARSVDVRRTLSEIAAETETILKSGGLSIEKVISLSPFYPDHAALLGRLA